MYQQIAWQISVVLITFLALAFVFVAVRSGPPMDGAVVQHKAYRIRRWWFGGLVAVGVPIMAVTLTDLPYQAADRTLANAVSVEAVGHQWYWTLSQTEFAVGEPVVFNISSADVNHGFGIYDEQLTLLAQAQAMPGYVNKLAYTFEQPGTYKILCLEFCGTAHHYMMAEIQVAEAKQQ